MWIAHQQGLVSERPDTFLGPVFVLLTTLPFVLAFWLSAFGWGWVVRPLFNHGMTPGERAVTQMAAGAAVLMLLQWLTAWLIAMNAIAAWSLVIVGIVLSIVSLMRAVRVEALLALALPPSALLVAVPLGLLCVAASCPPGVLWSVEAFGYDVLSYHLQVPREWLAEGRMIALPHNVFGYLPALLETGGYGSIAAMAGGFDAQAIYASQLLHVSFALLAACAVAVMIARVSTLNVTGVCAALFLAVPWVIINASMAYNEMGVLALGAAATLIATGPLSHPFRSAILVGFLAGAATLCKLTAGVMFAVPLAMILLARVWRAADTTPAEVAQAFLDRLRRCILVGVLVTGAGAATLSPYLVRNALWTGNPLFPFMTQTLGAAHWSGEQVDRWSAAVASEGDVVSRFITLARRGFCNPGYGAVGGTAIDPTIPTHDITRFDREWGFPLLGLMSVAGIVLGLTRRTLRTVTLAMTALLILQLAFWLSITHLQSRFLLPTVVPMMVLMGVFFGVLQSASRRVIRGAGVLLTVGSFATTITVAYFIFYSQTLLRLPPWQVADTLPTIRQLDQLRFGDALVGDHPINHLPHDSRTLLVGDASRLLYIRRPIAYASAFDTNQVVPLLRRVGDDPAALTLALKQAGFTHVWIHWSEIGRIHATLGLDAPLSPAPLRSIAQGWTPTPGLPDSVSLYALP